ncbi:MAG TPA: hypothetical protein VMC06_05990 [Opitutaceae bacterium]|nr:hypothetical protein [Opitutaceae bacterium]
MLVAMFAAKLAGEPPPADEVRLAGLIAEPMAGDWRGLARFDGILTRQEFESRMDRIFDPWGGLRDYLRLGRDSVAIYASARDRREPLVVIRFAQRSRGVRAPPEAYRNPGATDPPVATDRPLAGLRVVIEPADIGGAWAAMEDRSVDFPGYGRVNEGDLNLKVALILRSRLVQLGADVYLVRDRPEPILPIARDHLLAVAERLLRDHPDLLPGSMQSLAAGLRPGDSSRLRFTAGLLLTKTLETRARTAQVRRSFHPDITIVLQHDATPGSADGRLTPTNRNIFFVEGAYLPSELQDPWQRFRLLSKLLGNVTPTETTVAVAIAARFRAVTGFPPVLYGDSATTRLVAPDNPYVVARNLDFNREHDGPVVVTEPYFMNQPVTLARLVAGDYPGLRDLAGHPRPSIFREYADCVAAGLVDAYASHSIGR